MKYSKFLDIGTSVVGLAILASVSFQFIQAATVEVPCVDLGTITQIHEVKNPYPSFHKMEIATINKDGEIQTIKSQNVSSTENEKISSFTSHGYEAAVKAEINNKVHNLRTKSLKVNDSIQMCKNDTVKVKT